MDSALAKTTGTAKFLQLDGWTEMLSGLESKYSKRHLQRVNSELKRYGGTKKSIDIKTISFSDLVNKYDIKEIDYVSLDTEGGELEILESIFAYQECPIKCISIEDNYQDGNIKKLLEKQGYKKVNQLGCDGIYFK